MAAIKRHIPATGPFLPYHRTVHARDRATEIKQRCHGLGIDGVGVQCNRYSWAGRASDWDWSNCGH